MLIKFTRVFWFVKFRSGLASMLYSYGCWLGRGTLFLAQVSLLALLESSRKIAMLTALRLFLSRFVRALGRYCLIAQLPLHSQISMSAGRLSRRASGRGRRSAVAQGI
jgi:hypothetical protein